MTTANLSRLTPETAAERVAAHRSGDSKFFEDTGNHFIGSVERGEHDFRCEYLRGAPSYLCHCSKREREAKGFTEPPGDLEWVSPICPRCDEHVEHDGDSWNCPRCHAYWNSQGMDAQFYDDYGDLDTSLAEHVKSVRERKKVVDVALPEATA
jgi:hypothetical protein